MSLFFVLSGFVLSYQYANRSTEYSNYLVNRFARIYPIYALAAVLTIPWIGVSLGDGSTYEALLGLAKGFLLVVANVFLIQAWFPQFFPLWNDGASWSISVEAFCYLLLPFALTAMGRLTSRWLWAVTALCFVLAALPGLSVKLFETPASGVYYHMPIFRLPEFLCGVSAYLASRSPNSKEFSQIWQAVIILLYLSYLGVFGSMLPIYVGHNWLTIPVITFVVFTLSSGHGLIAKLLASRIAVWLGKISYCFYSFQALLILLLIDHHSKLISIIPELSNNRILAVASFLCLTTASALAHRFVEEPCRRWLRNRQIDTPQRAGFRVVERISM